ncbi:MAG TPA: hypothetical protein VG916_13225, partial [Gemmatimonadaceae bacterium]|nr:hypothetical protein [Gemmatimonadaceae bacterium]
MTAPFVLRGAAVAIAVLALVDPAMTRARRDRAVVAVASPSTHGDAEAGALAARVRARLARDFDVVPGAYAAADAIVVVGEELPAGAAEFRMPAFAVAPGRRTRVIVERVETPRVATAAGIVGVRATVRVRGAAGRTVTITLFAGGAPVDQTTHRVAGDDERFDVTLGAPITGEAAALRVEARTDGGASAEAGAADVAVRLGNARWNVLFHDTRPSWTSTFVRRALERDPRFAVASRIEASTGFAVATAAAPRLADAARRDRFDAIVVGAAEDLAPAD